MVSVSDVSDRERVKRILTAGGLLELAAVVSPPSPSPVQTYNTQAEAVASLKDKPAANRRVLPYHETEPNRNQRNFGTSRQPEKWVVVEAPAIVDGSELRSVAAVQLYAGSDAYQIHFSLGPGGAEKFGTWTGSHINDYLSVVLNGEVKSIAFIKSQITDTGEISGNFTKQTAEELALILRSGALPVPVKIVEESPSK
jgi:preprotein translocase subunit SecD